MESRRDKIPNLLQILRSWTLGEEHASDNMATNPQEGILLLRIGVVGVGRLCYNKFTFF